MSSKRYVVAISAAFLFATLLAACSNSNDSGSSPSEAPTSAAAAPEIAAGDFTADFSVMKQLTDLASQGTGLVGVLLPDTTTSARYVSTTRRT